jgi:chemotaxis response regulator CheB
MSNRDEGCAIARQELRTKGARWPALNMVKCMCRQPHPPVEFAAIRFSTDALFRSAAMPCGCRLVGAILTGVVCNARARGIRQIEKARQHLPDVAANDLD